MSTATIICGGFKIRDTRYSELGYANTGRNLWRFIDKSTGAAVGNHYRSKAELLVDCDAYALTFGCSLAKRFAEDRAIVRGGICPCCGGKVKRNLSLTGWWQCEQLGAVGFRKDASKPSCNWQTFVE